MDRNDCQHHFLKKIFQFLISVSFFSLLFCFSSSGFVSLFPTSFYLYFNTYLFSLLTKTLERKYMFLICNGIVAFLATTSSLSCNFYLSASDPIQTHIAEDIAYTKQEEEIEEEDYKEEEKYCEQQAGEEKEKGDEQVVEEERKNEELNAEDAGDKQFISNNDEEEEEDNREGDEANYGELGSTEELNRRIEEFIRKMKEEIRIEAQRQIVVV